MDGIGSEPRARTGHSSQAEILGISLINKSNLVPSGSVGPTLSIVSGLYVAMGISTLFSLEKQWKPTTDNFTSSSSAVVRNKLSLISLLPLYIGGIHYHLPSDLCTRSRGSYQVTSLPLLVESVQDALLPCRPARGNRIGLFSDLSHRYSIPTY